MSISALRKLEDERSAILAQQAANDAKIREIKRARAGEIGTLFEKTDLVLKSNSELQALIRFAESQPSAWWEEIAKTGNGSFRRGARKSAAGAAAAEPPAASNPQPAAGPDNGGAGETRPRDPDAGATGDPTSAY